MDIRCNSPVTYRALRPIFRLRTSVSQKLSDNFYPDTAQISTSNNNNNNNNNSTFKIVTFNLTFFYLERSNKVNVTDILMAYISLFTGAGP